MQHARAAHRSAHGDEERELTARSTSAAQARHEGLRNGVLTCALGAIFAAGLAAGLRVEKLKQRGRVERIGGVMGDVRLLEAKVLAAMIVGRGEQVIGERGSIMATLTTLSGLSNAAAEPWIQALDTVLDVRDLRAEDQISGELAGVGGVRRLGLKRTAAEGYEWGRDGQSVLAGPRREIV